MATTYYPEGASLTTTQKWQYDNRGRVTTAQLKFGVPSSWNVSTALPTYQQTQSYTDADQLETTTTSILNQNGQGYSFSQVYDQTLGLLTGLSTGSTSSANLASLNYNVNDLLGKISYQTSTGSNLAYEQFSYDGDLRPTEESDTWQGGSGQSGQFFDQARGYDAASNVTSASTTIGSNSESANYCYDEQDRLVWAGNSGTQPSAGSGTCGSLTLANSFPGATYNNTFTYTNLGQLWHAPLNGTGSTQQYLYCTSNSHQLQGVYPTGATCANPGTASYSVQYDAWGNLSSRSYNSQTATLSYDPLDQLVEWQVPGTNQAWYGYDGSGQRTLQRSTVGSTTSLTVYAFGLEEYHYDGSGNLQSSTHYYRLAGRLLGELQVNGSTQTTSFFLSDGLGSVLGVFSNTANSASLLASQLYYPYGASRYSSGSVSSYTNKGFTGQYNDPTSGLDYYGARYYDPVVGLFVSADKRLGDAQGVNPYAYVGENPETNNDPTGNYYSNETPITQQGGAIGYVGNGTITTVINDGVGSVWTADDQLSYTQGSLSVSTYTYQQATEYGGYDPLTDAANSTGAKISHELGLDVFQQSWNKPNATWQDKLGAVGQLALTNLNNVFQLMMIFGGPEDEVADAGGEEGMSLLDKVAQCAGLSFTPATPVATSHGEQAIGTIKVGEKVWAYNPKTKKMELQAVQHVWINHDNDLVDLTLTTASSKHGKAMSITSEVIHTNKKHPFLTKEKGFLPVGQITIGMHVLRADRTYGMVTGWKIVPSTKVMYNLEVAHDHTFTVGAGEWVVHNCGSLPELAQTRAEEIGTAIDSQIGSWSRRALTVGVATVENGDEVGTLITTNEGASNSLVNLVKAQLQEGETFVSLADNQGRHAEEVLVQYAEEKGLQIKGLGASNNFCDARCGPMLIQKLGQDLLGQPWPRP